MISAKRALSTAAKWLVEGMKKDAAEQNLCDRSGVEAQPVNAFTSPGPKLYGSDVSAIVAAARGVKRKAGGYSDSDCENSGVANSITTILYA